MTTREIPYRLSPTCGATKHGTANAYARHRCRCATAREAWRIYNKRRREGRNQPNCIDATGSTRRMQALVAIGWSLRGIGRISGYHHRTIQDVAYGRRRRITRQTAAWVADLYERLSGTPGGSRYALTVAKRNGYVPPLAWEGVDIDDPNAKPDLGTNTTDTTLIDEVAVRRALTGERIRLNPAEKAHAFRIGLRMDMSANQIGLRLGMNGGYIRELARRVLAEQAA
ncbi:hypothetical protein [Micromonospora chersina]|uniref:hypothetical protein n=1 Tax=Micromonospora chersina TaxID=47854 RepID=UPI0037239C2D